MKINIAELATRLTKRVAIAMTTTIQTSIAINRFRAEQPTAMNYAGINTWPTEAKIRFAAPQPRIKAAVITLAVMGPGHCQEPGTIQTSIAAQVLLQPRIRIAALRPAMPIATLRPMVPQRPQMKNAVRQIGTKPAVITIKISPVVQRIQTRDVDGHIQSTTGPTIPTRTSISLERRTTESFSPIEYDNY